MADDNSTAMQVTDGAVEQASVKGKVKAPQQEGKNDVEDVFAGLDIDLNAESNLLNADTEKRISRLYSDGRVPPSEAAKSRQRSELVNPIKLAEKIDSILRQHNLAPLGSDLNEVSINELAVFTSLAIQHRVRNVVEDSIVMAKHRTGITQDLFLGSISDAQSGWSDVSGKPNLKSKVDAKVVMTNDPRVAIQAIERDAKNAERVALEDTTLIEQGFALNTQASADVSKAPIKSDVSGDLIGEVKKTKRPREVPPVGQSHAEHASAQSTALMALGGVKKWMLGGLGETGRQLKKRTQEDISRGKGVGHQVLLKGTMQTAEGDAVNGTGASDSAATTLRASGQPGDSFRTSGYAQTVGSKKGMAHSSLALRFGVLASSNEAKLYIRRGFTPAERRKITLRDVLYVLEQERGQVSEALLAKYWAKVK